MPWSFLGEASFRRLSCSGDFRVGLCCLTVSRGYRGNKVLRFFKTLSPMAHLSECFPIHVKATY